MVMALQLKIRPFQKTEEWQNPQKQKTLALDFCKIPLPKTSLQPSKTQFPKTLISHSISITKRRNINFSIISLIFSAILPISTPNAVANEETEVKLERYTDSKEGFTILKPSSYIKVDKAGATVLFEEENKKANNVGIVVNPVKLTSLIDFGTPQFVADKLIQAEKRKESTKDAKVVGVTERPGLDDLPIYEFEYVVDSSRGGMKRIFSAAFVSRKKLYLCNISHVDKPDNPLDNHTRMMLEQVLHSFNAAPST